MKRSLEIPGFGPELGLRLRRLRQKRGLTQKQVAELMAGGRGQNMVSELEARWRQLDRPAVRARIGAGRGSRSGNRRQK